MRVDRQNCASKCVYSISQSRICCRHLVFPSVKAWCVSVCSEQTQRANSEHDLGEATTGKQTEEHRGSRGPAAGSNT